MQGRMKTHQLAEAEIDVLLEKSPVGHLGTVNGNGVPYVVPVHFVYEKGVIFIHGLNQGEKLSNIQSNPNVCLEVSEMLGFILDDKACDVNTAYNSVVVKGKAEIISDEGTKIDALNKVVKKYTPHLSGQAFPGSMLIATGIIKIAIEEVTGKYYK